MLNVFLCDDNEVLLTRYKKILTAIAKKHDHDVRFSLFTSGESLIFNLADSPNDADIIFLDILMGKVNGIDTARQLRAAGCTAEIIFLTSSDEFVFESFDTSPLHYILKGSTGEDAKIEEVFVRAISLAEEKENDVYLVETAGQKRKIPLTKISFFEIRGRIVTVHFGEETLDFYSSIDTISEELKDKKFVRCHKSFIVNLQYIDTLHKNELILTTGGQIPMGSSYSQNVKLAFSQNLSVLF